MRYPALQQRESFWNLLSEVERAFDLGTRENHRGFHPPLDLTETEDGFTLSLDLPGVPEANLSVEVQQGSLRISGERPGRGSFVRQFTLPPNVDEGAIRARHQHGVLEVTVPKAVAAKPRVIAINAPEVTASH